MRIKKLCFGYVVVLALSACSGGNSGGGGKLAPEVDEDQKKPQVSISRSSIIPTGANLINSGWLQVTNNSNFELNLSGVRLSHAAGFFDETLNRGNIALGDNGYNPAVNSGECKLLPAKGSCRIQISAPKTTDGSTSVSLTFSRLDASGKTITTTASQLVEYSSYVNKSSGFMVSNANIDSIASTQPYTIAIPFVVTENYANVEIRSRVKPLQNKIICSAGYTLNSSCTALLTMPVGPAQSYSNILSLVGTKDDGSVRSLDLMSGNFNIDLPHLSISHGPIEISSENISRAIHIVNDGTLKVDGIKEQLLAGTQIINNVIESSQAVLEKKITCSNQSSSAVVAALPSSLKAGEVCEVRFTLANPLATGFSDYLLEYSRGAAVGAALSKTVRIYHLGKSSPDYFYTVMGDLDFSNTQISSATTGGLTKAMTVTNRGKKSINNIEVAAAVNYPEGMSLYSAGSNCHSASLNPNQSCIYSLKYQPTTLTESKNFDITITADNNEGAQITPAVTRKVNYSAVARGAGLVFLPSENQLFLAANGKESLSKRVTIQNVGNVDFTLTGLSLSGIWNPAMTLTAESQLNNSHINNPFAGLSIVNGVTTGNSGKILHENELGELTFGYGPLNQEESGSFIHLLEGFFSGASIGSFPLTTNYFALSELVDITTDINVIPEDPNNPGDLNHPFIMTDNNILTITYTYKFKKALDAFRVVDNNLDLLWLAGVKSSNSCPQTSHNDATKSYQENDSCSVVIRYLPLDLSSWWFYTQASHSQPGSILAPGYEYHSLLAGHLEIKPQLASYYTPKPFAKVSATISNDQATGDSHIYTILFNLDSYAGRSLLENKEIVVALNLPQNSQIKPLNISNCQLSTSAESCSLTIIVPNGLPTEERRLLALYSSKQQSQYNTHGLEITLP